MSHIDGEAELYALGMLDDAERARVELHLTTCDACTALVGRAEEAVASLVDATQRVPVAKRAWWPMAAAASFAVAAGALLAQNVMLHGALTHDGMLLDTLVTAHFDHEQFSTPAGGPVDAKAIFERHGRWYEILTSGTPAWHIVLVHTDGAREAVQTPFERRDGASIVIVRPTMPVKTIELDDASGQIVGEVSPALHPEKE